MRSTPAITASLAAALAVCACEPGKIGAVSMDGAVPDGGGPMWDGAPDADPIFEQPPLGDGLATLAGRGLAGRLDGDRDHALFHDPVNLVVGAGGDLLVADFDNDLIRRVTPEGDVSTISQAPADGVFERPFGLALAGGWLYVQTDGNSLGQTAGAGAALWRMPAEGGPLELVRDTFGRARGLALLDDGRLAATFYQEHVVEIYDPAGNTFTPLAGAAGAPGDQDGSGESARFDQPYDVVSLADGSLLVADFGNHRLRRVGLDGSVSSYAGTGAAGAADGPLASATFQGPQGLARDLAGNVYVTDAGNYLVRRISPDGQVTTLAGDGTPGHRDSEDPRAGQLYGIEGIDAGADGYLYIADGSRGEDVPYHRLRRLSVP